MVAETCCMGTRKSRRGVVDAAMRGRFLQETSRPLREGGLQAATPQRLEKQPQVPEGGQEVLGRLRASC
jgi:hypothetical protein